MTYTAAVARLSGTTPKWATTTPYLLSLPSSNLHLKSINEAPVANGAPLSGFSRLMSVPTCQGSHYQGSRLATSSHCLHLRGYAGLSYLFPTRHRYFIPSRMSSSPHFLTSHSLHSKDSFHRECRVKDTEDMMRRCLSTQTATPDIHHHTDPKVVSAVRHNKAGLTEEEVRMGMAAAERAKQAESMWHTFVPERSWGIRSPAFWILLVLVLMLHQYNEATARRMGLNKEFTDEERAKRKRADEKRMKRLAEKESERMELSSE